MKIAISKESAIEYLRSKNITVYSDDGISRLQYLMDANSTDDYEVIDDEDQVTFHLENLILKHLKKSIIHHPITSKSHFELQHSIEYTNKKIQKIQKKLIVNKMINS